MLDQLDLRLHTTGASGDILQVNGEGKQEICLKNAGERVHDIGTVVVARKK